ncbi:MAG: GNAT family N-acetyltransferase [Novosphingobium sp.]
MATAASPNLHFTAAHACDGTGGVQEGARLAGVLHLFDPHTLSPADEAKWDALGRARSGDNVFAEPWMMRLSLAHCAPAGGAVRLAVVIDDRGDWLGVLPLIERRRHGRALWPNLAVWTHSNQFNAAPLLRHGSEPAFWRALLTGLDRQGGAAVSLCLTDLAEDDPACSALAEVCREQGRDWRIDRRMARACLIGDAGLAVRAEAAFRSKYRRRLASLERQLEREHGPLTLRSTRDAQEISGLIATFLSLEAAGWKGVAGSALDRADATRDFFTAAARAAAARGRFEISWLELGGAPVAMTTQFIGPQWSCGFKRAHDERFARFAPGQLHLKHLTQHLCAQGGPHFDSSAAPDQEAINRMWPDRRAFIDCHLAIGGPLHRLAHRALCAVQGAFHAIKGRRAAAPAIPQQA